MNRKHDVSWNRKHDVSWNRKHDVSWNQTQAYDASLRPSGKLTKKGDKFYYQGIFSIRKDSEINGGVYLASDGHEVIVVDDKKDKLLLDVYKMLVKQIYDKKAQLEFEIEKLGESNTPDEDLKKYELKNYVLRMAYDLVVQVMPYNQSWVEEIQLSNPAKNQMVLISEFISRVEQNGVSYRGGECRHQALLLAYLLEKLCEPNNGSPVLLTGRVSIDRNYVADYNGAHAWVRYTNSGGEVFILDPTNKYIGPLPKHDDFGEYWEYRRPEDDNPDLLKSRKNRLESKLKKWFGRIFRR